MSIDSERNAAIAHEVMHWISLGAHLWQSADGTVYYTGDDPARVFVPHTVFHPSTDALQAAQVEDQIRREGMWAPYLDTLILEFGAQERTIYETYATSYLAPEYAPVMQRVLLHATPAQRCRAALTVVRDAG
jgi:hypothetical protein